MTDKNSNGNDNLLEIQRSVESVQRLVEQNQKDYTDAKFQQLQNAFEQLKGFVATEIEHTEDMQDQKEKFSLQEFKQLSEKVGIYSNTYNDRLKLLERNTITKDKVENIMTKRSEKKWAERAVYILFFLSLLLSGYGGYTSMSSDFETHVEVEKQRTIVETKRLTKIEENDEEISKRHNQLIIDIETLKGYHR